MSIDEQHVALPKLYGAPAYARPPILVEETPRPLHPDDLPLVVEQTAEEQDIYRGFESYEFGTVPAGDTGEPDPDPDSPPRTSSGPFGGTLGRLFG